MTILYTTLGGTLQRHADGWRWSDGQAAPEVADLLLNECAPNFRCITSGSGTVVEIPHDWRSRKYWPSGRLDTETANVIDELVRDVGAKAPIYAEGLAEALDDHAARKHGYTVPVAQWDAALREPCGASWPAEREAAILDRARSLGWRG